MQLIIGCNIAVGLAFDKGSQPSVHPRSSVSGLFDPRVEANIWRAAPGEEQLGPAELNSSRYVHTSGIGT